MYIFYLEKSSGHHELVFLLFLMTKLFPIIYY